MQILPLVRRSQLEWLVTEPLGHRPCTLTGLASQTTDYTQSCGHPALLTLLLWNLPLPLLWSQLKYHLFKVSRKASWESSCSQPLSIS